MVGNLADGERGLLLTYATHRAARVFNLGAPGEAPLQALPAGGHLVGRNDRGSPPPSADGSAAAARRGLQGAREARELARELGRKALRGRLHRRVAPRASSACARASAPWSWRVMIVRKATSTGATRERLRGHLVGRLLRRHAEVGQRGRRRVRASRSSNAGSVRRRIACIWRARRRTAAARASRAAVFASSSAVCWCGTIRATNASSIRRTVRTARRHRTAASSAPHHARRSPARPPAPHLASSGYSGTSPAAGRSTASCVRERACSLRMPLATWASTVLRRDVQLLGDHAVRQPLDDEPHHGDLALAEGVVAGWGADILVKLAGNTRRGSA